MYCNTGKRVLCVFAILILILMGIASTAIAQFESGFSTDATYVSMADDAPAYAYGPPGRGPAPNSHDGIPDGPGW